MADHESCSTPAEPPRRNLPNRERCRRTEGAAREKDPTAQKVHATNSAPRDDCRDDPVPGRGNASENARGNRAGGGGHVLRSRVGGRDRKSTRLNSSHRCISYAVFCL